MAKSAVRTYDLNFQSILTVQELLITSDKAKVPSRSEFAVERNAASRIPLVYIASPSFSGSTLLTFLLNAHPAIATVGELKWGDIDIDTYQCSCGHRLIECPFWNSVRETVLRRGLPFDLARPPTDFRFPGRPLLDRFSRARLRGPLFEILRSLILEFSPKAQSARRVIQSVNRIVIQTALDLKRAVIFLDASKDPVRLKHIFDSLLYDIYIIQLIRDGRAVVHSARKNKRQTADQSALDWRNTHKQIERLRLLVSEHRFLRVQYEELCRRPQFVMREIFQFLHVDPSQAARNPNDVPHHILGNRMRLKPLESIQLDESWRNSFSPDDDRTFDRIAGTLNRKYGYD